MSSIGNELLSVYSLLNTLWSQGGHYTEVLLYCAANYRFHEQDVSIVGSINNVGRLGLRIEVTYGKECITRSIAL